MKSPGDVELTEAVLDAATLDALFADLAAHADVLDVFVKGGPDRRAREGTADLTAARALLDGEARGVQIRYRWDGDEWRDTVMRAPGGFRVIRTWLPR
jgi:hypothetical protein